MYQVNDLVNIELTMIILLSVLMVTLLKRKQPDSSHQVVRGGTLLIISHFPRDVVLAADALPKFAIHASCKRHCQHLAITSPVNVMGAANVVKSEASFAQCSLHCDSFYFFHFRFLSAFLLSSDLFILSPPSDYNYTRF